MTDENDVDYDVIVIGSGFGGSVAALRLSEKGYRVGVLEQGARWRPQDHPPNTWHLRKYLWYPFLGFTGPMQVTSLKNAIIQSAVGVGGGSLIYGNVLYEPSERFYSDPQWAGITDWKSELAPFYDLAKRMLGAVTNPRLTPSDAVLESIATDMGVASTFHPTQVGVFFGDPAKTVPDPYFGGIGPERAGCIFCAQCMTGCPHNAKNTLERNYLYLAEKAGAEIFPLTTVVDVSESPDGRYQVGTVRTGRWFSRQRRTWSADQVVFSAAAFGTQSLLHRLRIRGSLPRISARLGELARTNSEVTLTATSHARTDMGRGVAGTSSIHPDPRTHIEAFRMGKGSNWPFLLTTALIDGDRHRCARWLLTTMRHPAAFVRSLNIRSASERSLTVLVMQDLDNSLTTFLKRGLFGRTMTSRQGRGDPNQNWIPVANDVTRRVAAKIKGDAKGTYWDVVNKPVTAHFIGGCPIGESPDTGVVDAYQRLYGYPGLHIIDSSTISANLGANPALTVTAQSERAVALWPNKGDPDQRPPLGSPYEPVAPIAPRTPVVPHNAPGAFRLSAIHPSLEITESSLVSAHLRPQGATLQSCPRNQAAERNQ